MAVIVAPSGHEIFVDDEDLPLVSQYRWYACLIGKRRYAMRKIKGKTIYMHRLLLPGVPEVDHVNRNGLDNRRSNLRECSHSQNLANAETPRGRFKYRGIRLDRHRTQRPNPYQAVIGVKGRDLSLGYHPTPEDAARAYDRAARKHFGEFAFQNFPDPTGASDDNQEHTGAVVHSAAVEERRTERLSPVSPSVSTHDGEERSISM